MARQTCLWKRECICSLHLQCTYSVLVIFFFFSKFSFLLITFKWHWTIYIVEDLFLVLLMLLLLPLFWCCVRLQLVSPIPYYPSYFIQNTNWRACNIHLSPTLVNCMNACNIHLSLLHLWTVWTHVISIARSLSYTVCIVSFSFFGCTLMFPILQQGYRQGLKRICRAGARKLRSGLGDRIVADQVFQPSDERCADTHL